MKLLQFFLLRLYSYLLSTPVFSGYKFIPGEEVLTNCHEIYTKGKIKAQVDDGYTVEFPKNSGPIKCPPFRWHARIRFRVSICTGIPLNIFWRL